MTKNFSIAIVFAAVAITFSPLGAQNAEATSALEYDLGALPTDVAARVTHLETYGDRFDGLIRQIIAEATKPSWGWTNCDQSDVVNVKVSPDC